MFVASLAWHYSLSYYFNVTIPENQLAIAEYVPPNRELSIYQLNSRFLKRYIYPLF